MHLLKKLEQSLRKAIKALASKARDTTILSPPGTLSQALSALKRRAWHLRHAKGP